MKFLKYLAVGLAALLLLFVAIGLIQPSIHYSTSVAVDKPLDESFAVFMDDSKMHQWVLGLTSIKRVKGAQNEVGSVYEMVMERDGEIMYMTETLTGLKTNEHFGMQLENDVLTSQMDVYFKPLGEEKTSIEAHNEVRGSNVLYRSMFVLMQSYFQEEDAKTYELLKGAIEKNTTDYFPEQAEIQLDSSQTAVQ
ncbi:MAG: SRPBCC family protein [Bacteroidota bacterium]